MKRKRFYNNKNRNEKWTEEPVGRQIDFADKYVEGGGYSEKYSSKIPNSFDKEKKQKRKQKRIIRAVSVLLCALFICTGYIGMDVYMTRHAVPAEMIEAIDSTEQGSMSELAFDIAAYKIDSVSLDSSVMLSSVIHEVTDLGFSAVAFDIKRDDGTIGYASQLASIDTFSAVSYPSSQPEKSIKELLANDILPVARICCYRDNVVPVQASDMAIFEGENKLYTDSDGNNYLNPESEMTYNYIKDIVNECYGYGITVFSLYGCNLPDDITEGYNDGFDSLVKKLNRDLEGNVKFLEEESVEIKGIDPESGDVTSSAIKKELDELEKTGSNKIYSISADSSNKKVLKELDGSNKFSYIYINKQ